MKYINKETEEVGVELAKLLKEKDIHFNSLKGYYYYGSDILCLWNVVEDTEGFVADAPTQTEVRNMLIEVYNIDVVIVPERHEEGVNYLVQAQKFDLIGGCITDNYMIKGSYWFNDSGEYPTFKLALDKGLLEGIKLID